mgnify:CR=1 FL=1
MFNSVKLINIEKFWQEVWLRILVGGGFIFLNFLNPSIVIGFPLYHFQSWAEKYGIVSLVAPLFEELAFRFVLILVLFAIFVYLFKMNQNVGVFLAIIIQAIVFSAFHYLVYGASLGAMSASFIGALLFGLLVGFISYKNDYSREMLHLR